MIAFVIVIVQCTIKVLQQSKQCMVLFDSAFNSAFLKYILVVLGLILEFTAGQISGHLAVKVMKWNIRM